MNDAPGTPSSASSLAGEISLRLGIERSDIRGEHVEGALTGLKRVFAPLEGPVEDDVFAPPIPAAAEGSAPLWGVIVETREHSALPAVVHNVVTRCGIPVQVFHGRENREFIRASSIAGLVDSGLVILTPLNFPKCITQSRYNQLLLSPGFWRQMRGRQKILVFQTDAMCCPRSPYRIADFLAFDYIGSRWDRVRPVGLIIEGGSGGFSLRDWTLSLRCLERFPARRWPGGEDGYFAFHMELLGGNVASMPQAGRFSTQDVFEARSFGFHQIGRLGDNDLTAFLSYCPEAREIFSQVEVANAPAVHPSIPQALSVEASDKHPRPACAPALRPSGPISTIGETMFISHTYKFIYYEVPRTGSNSVTRALTELDPDSPTVAERRLRGGGEGVHYLQEDALADGDYRLIAAHRNPYDRLWSFWKHRKQNGNPEAFRSISWLDYVDWVCNPDSDTKVSGALADVPITEMLDIERVDYWLDFHRLEQNWEEMSRRLGIPWVPLKKLNPSPNHGQMQGAYSQQLGERVAERFARDFEYFNYPVDSWRPGVAISGSKS